MIVGDRYTLTLFCNLTLKVLQCFRGGKARELLRMK